MSHNLGHSCLRPLNDFEVEKVNLILRAPAVNLKDVNELRGFFVCLMTVGSRILSLFVIVSLSCLEIVSFLFRIIPITELLESSCNMEITY